MGPYSVLTSFSAGNKTDDKGAEETPPPDKGKEKGGQYSCQLLNLIFNEEATKFLYTLTRFRT